MRERFRACTAFLTCVSYIHRISALAVRCHRSLYKRMLFYSSTRLINYFTRLIFYYLMRTSSSPGGRFLSLSLSFASLSDTYTRTLLINYSSALLLRVSNSSGGRFLYSSTQVLNCDSTLLLRASNSPGGRLLYSSTLLPNYDSTLLLRTSNSSGGRFLSLSSSSASLSDT